MADEISLALLGCGRVAQRYLQVFTENEVTGARLTDVCDVQAERMGAFAERTGARPWERLDAMLDTTGARAVCIATPSGYHAAHIQAVLDSGRGVVVEKPVTMRVEDARRLTEEAERRGLMLAVSMQNRYNPAMRKLKSTVESGRLGRLVLGTVRVRWARDMGYYGSDAWRGKWASDGGVITNQAIHHIDALRWLMGPAEAVCATGTARLNDIEVDDTTVGIVRFANGALGAIEATTATRPDDVEASLSVLGEGGTVVVGGLALNEIETWHFARPEADDAAVPEKFSQAIPNAYGYGHAPLLQDAIDRLRDGRTDHPVDGHQGAQALEMVHALYRSMETGGWVDMAKSPYSERLGRR